MGSTDVDWVALAVRVKQFDTRNRGNIYYNPSTDMYSNTYSTVHQDTTLSWYDGNWSTSIQRLEDEVTRNKELVKVKNKLSPDTKENLDIEEINKLL